MRRGQGGLNYAVVGRVSDMDASNGVTMKDSMSANTKPILFYDGVCGLCNRLVQFTLRHDPNDVFRFARLQSPLAAGILGRHGETATDLDTFYVVSNAGEPGESILARSDAAIFVLKTLGGVWAMLGALWSVLPHPIRDALYNLIARNRYHIFGKFDACPLPDPRHQHKFLDV
jgi:predicted DCC family thiol-disulfide oxidoreductase YuxK